jgi:hypothetical protein
LREKRTELFAKRRGVGVGGAETQGGADEDDSTALIKMVMSSEFQALKLEQGMEDVVRTMTAYTSP